MSFDLEAEAPLVQSTHQEINQCKATELGQHIEQLWTKLRDKLALSQEVMLEFANRNCTNTPVYQIGDSV